MRHLLAALAAASLSLACSQATTPPVPVTVTPAPAAPSPPAASEHHAGHHDAPAVDREQVDADGVVRRGSALTAALEVLPVSVAIAKAKELDGKKVKLRGIVTSACQPQGCWFVVRGDKPEDTVRISAKAHNIFVPKSAAGKVATVEGVITIKVLTQAMAQHFEDERDLKVGEARKTITGDVTELAIDVAGLTLEAA